MRSRLGLIGGLALFVALGIFIGFVRVFVVTASVALVALVSARLRRRALGLRAYAHPSGRASVVFADANTFYSGGAEGDLLRWRYVRGRWRCRPLGRGANIEAIHIVDGSVYCLRTDEHGAFVTAGRKRARRSAAYDAWIPGAIVRSPPGYVAWVTEQPNLSEVPRVPRTTGQGFSSRLDPTESPGATRGVAFRLFVARINELANARQLGVLAFRPGGVDVSPIVDAWVVCDARRATAILIRDGIIEQLSYGLFSQATGEVTPAMIAERTEGRPRFCRFDAGGFLWGPTQGQCDLERVDLTTRTQVGRKFRQSQRASVQAVAMDASRRYLAMLYLGVGIELWDTHHDLGLAFVYRDLEIDSLTHQAGSTYVVDLSRSGPDRFTRPATVPCEASAIAVSPGGRFVIAAGDRIVVFDNEDASLVELRRSLQVTVVPRQQQRYWVFERLAAYVPTPQGVTLVAGEELLEIGFDGGVRRVRLQGAHGADLYHASVEGECIHAADLDRIYCWSRVTGARLFCAESPGLNAGRIGTRWYGMTGFKNSVREQHRAWSLDVTDGSVEWWDVELPPELHRVAMRGAVNWFSFEFLNERAYLRLSEGGYYDYDIANRRIGAQANPDPWRASSSADGSVAVYPHGLGWRAVDANTNEVLGENATPEKKHGSLGPLAYDRVSGRMAALDHLNWRVMIWDRCGSLVTSLPGHVSANAISFEAGGRRLLTVDRAGVVRLWEVQALRGQANPGDDSRDEEPMVTALEDHRDTCLTSSSSLRKAGPPHGPPS